MVYMSMTRWEAPEHGWSRKVVAVVLAKGDNEPALLSMRAREMVEILCADPIRADHPSFSLMKRDATVTVNLLNAKLIDHEDGRHPAAVAAQWRPTLREAVAQGLINHVTDTIPADAIASIQFLHDELRVMLPAGAIIRAGERQ